MEPVLHLSIPVRDLADARAFYVDVLGCRPGRVRDGWLDVWFHGMQVTLQERPDEVLAEPGVRHFGVTLGAEELADVLHRVAAHPVRWLHPVTTDFAGTSREQTKAKLLDPSGNVIELKSYAHAAAAFDD
jgi:extradiol dioxygenase family protein